MVTACHSKNLAGLKIRAGDTCSSDTCCTWVVMIVCNLEYSILGKDTVEVEYNFIITVVVFVFLKKSYLKYAYRAGIFRGYLYLIVEKHLFLIDVSP